MSLYAIVKKDLNRYSVCIVGIYDTIEKCEMKLLSISKEFSWYSYGNRWKTECLDSPNPIQTLTNENGSVKCYVQKVLLNDDISKLYEPGGEMFKQAQNKIEKLILTSVRTD